MCSELGNSCIRVAVDDCSVTECRPWRPPFQTVKTVHVHTKHYKHNENGRTAPGVRGHGSVPPSHLGNVVTGIVLQQRAAFFASFKKTCWSRKCSYGFEIYAFPLAKFEQIIFSLFVNFTP